MVRQCTRLASLLLFIALTSGCAWFDEEPKTYTKVKMVINNQGSNIVCRPETTYTVFAYEIGDPTVEVTTDVVSDVRAGQIFEIEVGSPNFSVRWRAGGAYSPRKVFVTTEGKLYELPCAGTGS